MLRTKGYGIKGKKLLYRGEFTRKPRTSLLVFIGINGLLDCCITEGTFTRLTFLNCLKEFALTNKSVKQYPGPHSVWIMDGAKIHCGIYWPDFRWKYWILFAIYWDHSICFACILSFLQSYRSLFCNVEKRIDQALCWKLARKYRYSHFESYPVFYLKAMILVICSENVDIPLVVSIQLRTIAIWMI